MVKAWRELVTIPTYEVGKPEKSPMFLEKRVYQGSSGVVYPYPVIESISNEKKNVEYLAVWLENEYIKVMILPELGGRVQMAYDKIKQRHFVYYNHVIKPALVGLAGPWISGGIEFNWPQHHRPSTFMPVDVYIESNDEDGSVTVWTSEMEKMFHQKGAAGFTLRPGCAYLEIKGLLYNRTDMPQTFLWWANPAVAVNDEYQSVFPPDINAVFDHGKRAVSSFPIATGTYYKMDYSAGVDISNYRNIKVPTSYMGVNSRFNFEGGYENDTKGGMLHVASHHFSPGKKQWTWGNGDFGQAWDRNLTDEDGPYIELMAGVYTENQPDFTWLMPYEEKRFTQYFMPYRDLGVVKEASKDLVFNIDNVGDSKVCFKLYATHLQHIKIVLRNDDGTIYHEEELDISPKEVLEKEVNVGDAEFSDLTFEVSQEFAYGSRVVLRWHAEDDEIRPIPDSAEAALPPHEVKTNEQLYLTAIHLEQYRHATWSPVDYYEEALRRDPNDARCLNAYGLWLLRRGRFDKAEPMLRHAVKIITKRNPNPYDSEPIYNLALCLKYQGKKAEAYELFWKSTWSKACADAGYFEAAKISVEQRRFEDALDEVERCLDSNWHNHKARALKAAILRYLRRNDEALALISESLKMDQFNYGCRYEQYLLTNDDALLNEMKQMLRHCADNYNEVALDYQAAGLTDEANALWQIAIDENAANPMTYYYMQRYKDAAEADYSYCFPNRLEDIQALENAKRKNPSDAMAPYYLGCLFYAARQYDLAIENWELSSQKAPMFPLVWRNLALARFNKQGREKEALGYMQNAFKLDTTDARMLMELDQLSKRLHHPHAERLEFLQQYPELIEKRDDLVLEEITLLNQVGKYIQAKRKLDAHIFHPWEGGEGKVPAQYQICRVELAKQNIAEGKYKCAVGLLEQCLTYPHHLGEGKLYGAQENDFYYLLGVAYDALGYTDEAKECWEKAVLGPQEPAAAMYYNDAKPDKIFYQGMALRKLGREDEAHGRFYRLINYGKQHVFEHQTMDYFAVSLPDLLIWDDSLDTKNVIHCKYMLALGYCGMGDMKHALKYLAEVEALDNNHQGAQQLRSLIDLNLLS